MRLAVNAVGLAPGGGLTYLINQALEFRKFSDLDMTYFVSPRCEDSLRARVSEAVVRVPFEEAPGYRKRIWWEQLELPKILRQERFDALYLPGGFAIFKSPIPQLIVDHNPHHHAKVKEVGINRLWLRGRVERFFAKLSARRAERVVYLSKS